MGPATVGAYYSRRSLCSELGTVRTGSGRKGGTARGQLKKKITFLQAFSYHHQLHPPPAAEQCSAWALLQPARLLHARTRCYTSRQVSAQCPAPSCLHPQGRHPELWEITRRDTKWGLGKALQCILGKGGVTSGQTWVGGVPRKGASRTDGRTEGECGRTPEGAGAEVRVTSP